MTGRIEGGVVTAIHQPNFAPWPGYFDKIARCDIFIFLDDALFSKGSYTNRVRVIGGGNEPVWLTVPIETKGVTERKIRDVAVKEGAPWRRKHISALRHGYARAPFREEVLGLIEGYHERTADMTSLADLNIGLIGEILGYLGVAPPRFERSSDLGVEGRATIRLANLTKAVGGTHYLHGGGARNYQEDEVLEEAGLAPVAQGYLLPEYDQGGRGFTPGLSILDALFNLGPEAAELIGN